MPATPSDEVRRIQQRLSDALERERKAYDNVGYFCNGETVEELRQELDDQMQVEEIQLHEDTKHQKSWLARILGG